jgi:hypothetical protein
MLSELFKKKIELNLSSAKSETEPKLNPIKIITPTPKFWSWRNYENSLFQSYKSVLPCQN